MNHQLRLLSDSHLMNSTVTVLTTLRRVDLALLEHLGEIESRELHLKSGYSSLFKMWCATRRLVTCGCKSPPRLQGPTGSCIEPWVRGGDDMD